MNTGDGLGPTMQGTHPFLRRLRDPLLGRKVDMVHASLSVGRAVAWAPMSSLASAPVVLIHGLFGHLNDKQILGAFGDTPVHAPDLIGYGTLAEKDTAGLTLRDQAKNVVKYIRRNELGPVHLVGHSVGGAIAVLIASDYPDLVASLTSVEGNFTIEDAFWSSQLADKPDSEVEAIIDLYRSDPDAWIEDAGVPISEWTHALAVSWLENQPPATIQAQARAVVSATSTDIYLGMVRMLLKSPMPFHLVAGERSQSGWNVPDWVRELATSDTAITDTGHLMMAEDPQAFADTVLGNIRS